MAQIGWAWSGPDFRDESIEALQNAFRILTRAGSEHHAGPCSYTRRNPGHGRDPAFGRVHQGRPKDYGLTTWAFATA